MQVVAQRFPFRAMGAPCQIQLHGGPEAPAIARRAVDEVLRLEVKYSRYREDSTTARINAAAGTGAAVEVDDETAALLDYARTGFEHSDGCFDITAGVLRRAWDFRSGRLPSAATLAELCELIGWQKVRWERPQVALPARGMELDFGGYVKEYAADRVAELCRGLGARHGFVDLGGDIALIGPRPNGEPWAIGVRNPRQPDQPIASVTLVEGAIATSGDYERYMIVDGVRYAHILDPSSGWPVRGLASVSVLAPHCVVAGTATTIAMLMGTDEGLDWLAALGLPYLAVDQRLAVHGTLGGAQPPNPPRTRSPAAAP